MSIQHKSFGKWNGSYIKDNKFHKIHESSAEHCYVKLVIKENLTVLELMNSSPQEWEDEKLKSENDLNIRREVALFKIKL